MSFMIDMSGDLAARSVGQQTGLLFAGVGAVLVLPRWCPKPCAGASAARPAQ